MYHLPKRSLTGRKGLLGMCVLRFDWNVMIGGTIYGNPALNRNRSPNFRLTQNVPSSTLARSSTHKCFIQPWWGHVPTCGGWNPTLIPIKHHKTTPVQSLVNHWWITGDISVFGIGSRPSRRSRCAAWKRPQELWTNWSFADLCTRAEASGDQGQTTSAAVPSHLPLRRWFLMKFAFLGI